MSKNNLGLSEEDIEALRNAASPTAEIMRAIQNLSDRLDAEHKESGKLERKRYRITTAIARSTIMSFLKWARMSKRSNLLVEGLTVPAGAAPSQRSILQPDALKTLFSEDTTLYRGKPKFEPYIYAFRFAVVTGFRPGELIALQHSNITGNRYKLTGSINIRGDRTHGKNDNARRSGELSATAMSILNSQRLYLISNLVDSDYIFPDHIDPARPMLEKNYYRHWKRYCAAHGITEGTSVYELRHTFCSINDEMPEGLKKMIMGHSKNMDTEGVYGHRKRGDDERAAAYIDRAMEQYLTSKK